MDNSIIANLGSYNALGDSYDLIGLRLNMSGSNNYHDAADKTGSIDQWTGYTVAFSIADREGQKALEQYKAGATYNADFWVSPKRYFGVYSYLEAGLQDQNYRGRFLFSPAIGIQPGPLLGIDDYTLPRWLGIPLQMFLPFKIVFNPNIVPGLRPAYTIYGEIDLLF